MQVLVYGSGQLARMMYLAGAPLNIKVDAVDVSQPEKPVVVHPVCKTPLTKTLAQAIEQADVLTVEFEHVPESLLEEAQISGKLQPNISSILVGADRVREKQLLQELEVANCEHEIITDVAQLAGICERLGDKIIFKASRDGYDGYGQWRLSNASDLAQLATIFTELDLENVPLVAEKMCQFDRELSLVGARNAQGDIALYDLVENSHYQGQLHVSIAPAPMNSLSVQESLANQALDIFTKIATRLDYVGVLAVEVFQVGEQLMVNELAPRVHNSGHWTMHGSVTCQFENHLRAICSLPLGATKVRQVSAMLNVIGCQILNKTLLSVNDVHLHWYDKSVRDKRKMGHINVNASNYSQLGDKIAALDNELPSEFFPLLSQTITYLKGQ